MSAEWIPSPSESDPPQESRSAWLTFFDTFLQEKNIKWMLGLGGLILLGSSLMLVTSHWQEYTPLWKSLVVMAYTLGIYAAGEVAYRQMVLRRTGTSLFAMTVLLIPISFLAVGALHGELASAGHLAGIAGVLLANTLFAAIAGRRILHHFLHEDQPTFLASYLGLSLAGAVVPAIPESWAWLAAFVLWGLFAIGTIKGNRHVFWLGEEHRLPRIFGFFPILLLGLQFLTLFAFLAPDISSAWIGFGMVLTAIPILAAADALAKVFEERTGNLVRPLPWSLLTPLYVGMALCVGGVWMSFAEVRASIAPVPSAVLAGMIFLQVARRTQHAGFVWAMWGSVVFAYQASPVFFRELARSIVHQGAEAVAEPRLPLAFYGLTYLPLLVAATLIAVVLHRHGKDFFARPTQSFVVLLTTLLWMVSLTHVKALFPVGLASLGMLTGQMFLFRQPGLKFAAAAAWITMSFGIAPFLSGVLGHPLPAEASLWIMSLSAGMLLLPDRFLGRLSDSENSYAIGDAASFVLTLTLCAAWVFSWNGPTLLSIPWASAAAISGLLLIHAYRWCLPLLGLVSLLYAGGVGIAVANAFGVPSLTILSGGVIISGLLWLVANVLRRHPQTRLSRTFGGPLEDVSGLAMAAVLLLFSLPGFAGMLIGIPQPEWWVMTAAILPVVWSFHAASRWKSPVWTYLGCLGVLGLAGSSAVLVIGLETTRLWWVLIAAVTGYLGMLAAPRPFRWSDSKRDHELSNLHRCIRIPIGRSSTVLFVALAVGTLPVFSLPCRIASLVSLAGLFLLVGNWSNATLRHLALALLNWHLISGLVQIVVPGADHLGDLDRGSLLALSLPLALAASLSRLVWNLARTRRDTLGEWINFHRLLLLGTTTLGLVWSLKYVPIGLSFWNVAVAAGVFLSLVADQIWQAIRRQDEGHVWAAEGLLLALAGYLLLFDVIHFGSGLSLYAVLIAGWSAWTMGYLTSRSESLQILARPFRLTGYTLPAVTVGLGIVRHFAVPQSLWLGMNSLALLLAGGFYFWRAIEEKRRDWMLAAAVILNTALALLWRELSWYDPQLFANPLGISILALVEWFKHDIPQKAHDPLRYLGALVILVSPVFHIVSGSWIHLLTLMIASVAVTLAAMGLRIRALMYTGTGFLIGDLLAMVVRGSVDNPTLLWIAGVLFGFAVIALAAYCEKNREDVLARLRIMAAKLETWE